MTTEAAFALPDLGQILSILWLLQVSKGSPLKPERNSAALR